MKIAYDALALSCGLHAGIYNVTRAHVSRLPELFCEDKYFFLVDKEGFCLSEALPEKNISFVEKISSRKIVRNVNNAYCEENQIRIYVDGEPISHVADGNFVVFKFERCKNSVVVETNINIPSLYDFGSMDDRELGIAIYGLTICTPLGDVEVSFHELSQFPGFYEAEENFAWTSGKFLLPASLFSGMGLNLTCRLSVSSCLPCYSNNICVDKFFGGLIKKHSPLLETVDNFLTTNLLSKIKPDIFHANHFFPYLVKGSKLVATAYDLIPYLRDDTHTKDARLHFDKVVRVLKRCDRIQAISQSTKDDLVKHLKIKDSLVDVVYVGVDDCFTVVDKNYSTNHLLSINITSPYLLCVGTIEPRKNQDVVVKAFNMLKSNALYKDFKLIFVGARGWMTTSFDEEVSRSKFKNDILLLNFIPQETLVCLYNNAFATIYVSSYEGFGLPCAESMACGCPVVTSNVSSMPEIVGDAGVLVNQLDPGDICSAVDILTNNQVRSTLINLGLKRSNAFRWNEVMQNVHTSYLKLLQFLVIPMIYLYYPSIRRKDAIGCSIIKFYMLLKSKGIDAKMICEIASEQNDKVGEDFKKYIKSMCKSDILVVNYGFYDINIEELLQASCKKIFVYHNITPGFYFEKYDEDLKKCCEIARDNLSTFRCYFDAVVSDSEYNKSDLVSCGYDNVKVVPIFVEMLSRSLHYDFDQFKKYRAENAKVFIFCGRFVPNKGHFCLIEFMKEFVKLESNSKLTMLGSVWSYAYLSEIYASIKNAKLSNNIEVVHDVDENELLVRYISSDAFISMSEHEGFMVPLVESYYCNVPVFAYGCTAIPETMGNGGVIFKEKNYSLIASTVKSVLDDNDFLLDIRYKQSKELKKYDVDQIFDQWIDIFNSL